SDQVAALVLEFIEEAVTLRLADLLDNDLLGGLGGDPAEIGWSDRRAVRGGRRLAGVAVDPDLDLFSVGIVLLRGRGQRRFDPLEQDLLGDILVAVDAIDDTDQIDAHDTEAPRHAETVRAESETRPREARFETIPATGRWPVAMPPRDHPAE